MIDVKNLVGEKISLRLLEISDCQKYYLDWLNDKEVNQYLETRWQEQSLDSIKDFVATIRESSHSYLFAIIYEGKHVGNIKMGPIHPIYKHADISYFIGDKNVWGKGVATEAVSLIIYFAFKVLKLNRLQAGAFEQNVGSQKVLLKCGFKREAIYRKKVFLTLNDVYCDIYEYSILKSEYEEYKNDYNKTK